MKNLWIFFSESRENKNSEKKDVENLGLLIVKLGYKGRYSPRDKEWNSGLVDGIRFQDSKNPPLEIGGNS